MATQLQMVNRVLRRLREDEVSTVNENTYSKLIAEFVNDAVEEVATAYDWKRFVHQTYAETFGSGGVYQTSFLYDTTSGSGSVVAGTVFTSRTKLTWIDHDVPSVLYSPTEYPTSLTTVTRDWYPLSPMSYEEFVTWSLTEAQQLSAAVDGDQPSHFTLKTGISPSTGAHTHTLYFLPSADSGGTLSITAWTPPEPLELDNSDAATVISTPDEPTFRYALMLALNERGEEIGEPGNVAESRYYEALSKAIEDELDFEQRTNRHDWRRD